MMVFCSAAGTTCNYYRISREQKATECKAISADSLAKSSCSVIMTLSSVKRGSGFISVFITV